MLAHSTPLPGVAEQQLLMSPVDSWSCPINVVWSGVSIDATTYINMYKADVDWFLPILVINPLQAT